jgi:hypothetical protein
LACEYIPVVYQVVKTRGETGSHININLVLPQVQNIDVVIKKKKKKPKSQVANPKISGSTWK